MKLGSERMRPAAVASRMDLYRDLAATLVQLQGARSAGDTEMPVAASRAASETALASNHETASFALLEDLLSAEINRQLQHRVTIPLRDPHGALIDSADHRRMPPPGARTPHHQLN